MQNSTVNSAPLAAVSISSQAVVRSSALATENISVSESSRRSNRQFLSSALALLALVVLSIVLVHSSEAAGGFPVICVELGQGGVAQ